MNQSLLRYDANDKPVGPYVGRPSKQKRRNEFHHHIGKARVWLRNARSALPTTRRDLIAKARTDRAVAFAWLGA